MFCFCRAENAKAEDITVNLTLTCLNAYVKKEAKYGIKRIFAHEIPTRVKLMGKRFNSVFIFVPHLKVKTFKNLLSTNGNMKTSPKRFVTANWSFDTFCSATVLRFVDKRSKIHKVIKWKFYLFLWKKKSSQWELTLKSKRLVEIL